MAERLDLFGDPIHHERHTLLRTGVGFFHAGERQINARGIIVQIVQLRQLHELRHIGEIDPTHGFELLTLPIQLRIAR